jgi:hypothetical protein
MPKRQKGIYLIILSGLFLMLFSFWLMFHTFSFDSSTNQLLIAAKASSDFASHIPHIRSFSKGLNWPPQFPLYPGEPTRYHFLFYAMTGILEKFGLRIDLALNLFSGLGFLSLVLLILIFNSTVFSSLAVGLLAVLFFLFNGSFSFLDFLNKIPPGRNLFSVLVNNTAFPSFGPWNGSEITAFWNLNIYTNQRHLGLSFAVILLIIYILVSRRKKLFFTVGFLAGSLLLLNQAGFLIAVVFVGWFFISEGDLRLPLLYSGLGFIPWLLLTLKMVNLSPQVTFKPGYLIPGDLNLLSFIRFWFLNLGLHTLLIPLGIILAPGKIKKSLVVPLTVLFIVPNLFRFSPDMINNHKLFNFFLIIGAAFSAYAVVRIWKTGFMGKITALFLVLLLTLGGLVDFFPVKNDYFVRITDLPVNPDIQFFIDKTPPGSVILNSFWLYHPASLAGRFIYNGYPYFTWSYGYDQVKRENSALGIYSAPSKLVACQLLKQNRISYVELSPYHEEFIHPNAVMWQSEFYRVYQNPVSGFTVYDVKMSCNSL